MRCWNWYVPITDDVCNGLVSVHPSTAAAVCGWFAAECGRLQHVDWQLVCGACTCSAANAGSVMLRQDEGHRFLNKMLLLFPSFVCNVFQCICGVNDIIFLTCHFISLPRHRAFSQIYRQLLQTVLWCSYLKSDNQLIIYLILFRQCKVLVTFCDAYIFIYMYFCF